MVVVSGYLITIHVDNIGYIYQSENTSVSRWKNHIDVHHHFIRYYVEDGSV